MKTAQGRPSALFGLLLFVFSIGMLGISGFTYAADRTVIGELFSADN